MRGRNAAWSVHRLRSSDLLSHLWREAAGAAQANREVVTDQSAAATGQDRWLTGEVRAVLLAVACRRASDAAAVRGHGAADRSATGTDGVADPQIGGDSVMK